MRESLLIGGWVAMWRPLEVFLYDWWPIRAEARLFDRLSAMPVRIEYDEDATRRRVALGLARDAVADQPSTARRPLPNGRHRYNRPRTAS